MTELEKRRHKLQVEMDKSKTIEERRKFGQFSTPYDLAKEIMSYSLKLQTEEKVCFLEPAVGTGVFLSALHNCLSSDSNLSLEKSVGIEIDSSYFNIAQSLWKGDKIINSDFTKLIPSEKYNLLVSNPPYVRHHLIPSSSKGLLSKAVESEVNLRPSGLMGLYCYFILLAHKWLAERAVSSWLIPSEFMDVNYGFTLKQYLLNNVHLIRIHRYAPVETKFDDALVSSCVVFFVNEKINDDYDVEFSYGGTIENPQISKRVLKSQLEKETKWTRFPEKDVRNSYKAELTLGDFFEIKRGIATGDNDFFILTQNEILNKGFSLDSNYFKPILPSPRKLKIDCIDADENGLPIMETKYFLLSCGSVVNDENIKKYLDSGKLTTATKYICKNRRVWYQQEKRLPTQFLCSYMGRGSGKNPVPFRFILNNSNAIATNSYLMLYPKNNLQQFLDMNNENANLVWEALRQINALDFSEEQRVYGGGLKKIEPRELAKVKCKRLNEILRNFA